MSIRFDSEARIFVLETAHTSYHMKVDALGHLLHLYYGKTIGTGDLMQLYPRTDRGFSPDYYAYRTLFFYYDSSFSTRSIRYPTPT